MFQTIRVFGPYAYGPDRMRIFSKYLYGRTIRVRSARDYRGFKNILQINVIRI